MLMINKSNSAREILRGGYDGKKVLIEGWVSNIKSNDGIISLIVRDGSGYIPVIVEIVKPELYRLASEIKRETAVRVSGGVFLEGEKYGIRVESLDVLSKPKEDFSLNKDVPLELRHLQVREPKQRATIIVESTALNAMREYLKKEGFTEVLPPTITLMAAEDPNTLFSFPYFNQGTVHLSQTAQPYLEAFAQSLKKVYSITPTYRREESKTRKHLSEFNTLEAEQAFSDLDDTISLTENLFVEIIRTVADVNYEELETLGREVSKLNVKAPFKRITYDEAIKIYNEAVKAIEPKEGKKSEVKWGEGFGSEEEDILCEIFGLPFFVTHFPVKARPFYMRPDPNRSDITLSYDMFAPFAGEVVTGSERITDYDLITQRITDHGLPHWAYGWYINLRKYGLVQQSGFGMGIERALMYITGLKDIRDVSLFPRVSDRRPYP